MLDNIFGGLFSSATETVISPGDFIICLVTSLAIGIFLSVMYTIKSKWTKSFVITLSMLPAVVCIVIMTVNGNVGAGVAVAGAFSLVRFRSVPGTARDIGTLFLAMGAGLMCGMGYLAYAVLFAVIMGLMLMLFTVAGNAGVRKLSRERTLRITMPEDLDYTTVFDDLMEKYTSSNEVVSVKTVNMGSLFRLTYNLTLRDPLKEKEFIDELRCRNGNLEISMSKAEVSAIEL